MLLIATPNALANQSGCALRLLADLGQRKNQSQPSHVGSIGRAGAARGGRESSAQQTVRRQDDWAIAMQRIGKG